MFGVYLGLEILPLEITSEDWNGFCDQALARAFPLPLQRFTVEENLGYNRFVLTRNLASEKENGRFFAVT